MKQDVNMESLHARQKNTGTQSLQIHEERGLQNSSSMSSLIIDYTKITILHSLSHSLSISLYNLHTMIMTSTTSTLTSALVIFIFL